MKLSHGEEVGTMLQKNGMGRPSGGDVLGTESEWREGASLGKEV